MAYLFSVAGLIACKDVSFFEAFSCPWTPPSPFYKLLEIKRFELVHDVRKRGKALLPALLELLVT